MSFEPVPGWDATLVEREGKLDTYKIRKCPLYIKEAERLEDLREIEEIE